MSALWIHLEMYPLFISPVYRSFGKMVENVLTATPISANRGGGGGGRGGREHPALKNDAVETKDEQTTTQRTLFVSSENTKVVPITAGRYVKKGAPERYCFLGDLFRSVVRE